MKKNSRKTLLKEYLFDEKGAAMIVVLCVMAIVLAVCLSLLLAVYQMFATVNDEAKDDIYYHQALSGSMAIQAELEKEAQAMPRSVSTIQDYIFYFMANTTNFPAPYRLTFNQQSKSGSDAASFGDATITLEKIDNGSGAWGDDYNCYCYITFKMSDEAGEKETSVTSKYLVTCENSSYTYIGTVTDSSGNTYSNISYTYSNYKLIATSTEIPEKVRKIPYSTAAGKLGILENYVTIDGTTYSIEITRTRNDESKYVFQFLERM
ncbi:MAG: hypothetical protein K6A23_14470 [Butyrivibrio sp.]|nr:hypothetical protein [Butyrivibrio sp.]